MGEEASSFSLTKWSKKLSTMISRLVLLLLFTSLAHGDVPGHSATGDRLIMTMTFTRHADRAPEADNFITKVADYVFFRGRGELSTEGLQNSQKMGAAYRKAYVDSGFINGMFLPAETSFTSTQVDRTMMTAASFSAGIFGDVLTPIIAPIAYTPFSADSILGLNFDCTNGWDDVVEMYGMNETTNMKSRLLESMRQTEWNCAQPPASQSDTIIAEHANSVTKIFLTQKEKECAKDQARRFMYKYILLLGGSGTNDANARIRLQRTIGALSKTIVDSFKTMQCHESGSGDCVNKKPKKAQFVFFHDVNLMALINVFSMQNGVQYLYKGLTPQFASSLSMELWTRADSTYVKMFFKDGPNSNFVDFDYCQFLPTNAEYPRVGKYCSLEAFERAKNEYINTDDVVCVMPK